MEKIKVNSERWFDLTLLKNEEFRDIKGYEGFYQVSNYGRVKSVERYIPSHYRGRILKFSKPKGYFMVGLCKNCREKSYLVHRLVATAFIPNPNNLPEVNHKKGIKEDNRVTELEWSTRLHNQQEAERLGLVKSPMRKAGYGHPSNKKIIKLDDDGNVEKEYYSITNASLDIGVPVKHLSYCLINSKRDKRTNSLWKYAKE